MVLVGNFDAKRQVMHLKEWLKSAAIAAGAGTASATWAMILDPHKFNLSNGLVDEALIALQGGIVGLACLLIRSPMGTTAMKFMEDTKAKSKQ